MPRQLLSLAILGFGLSATPALAGGPEILVEPDYFSGFFVGGTGAFHATGFQGSTTAFSDTAFVVTGSVPLIPPVALSQIFFPAGVLTSGDINGNSYDGYYGVQGGVGKVFNHRWYAGVVGFGEWGSQQDTSSQLSQFSNTNNSFVDGGTPVSGTYQSSTTVKLSNNYGVAFKPGFLVAPRTMLYGKVGAVWANLKISNSFLGSSQANAVSNESPFYQATATLSGSSTVQENRTGLLLGLGAEQFIYRDFITINVEYNYTNYGSISTVTPLTGQGEIALLPPLVPPNTPPVTGDFTGTAQSDVNVKAKVSTLLVGLNFYFGSHWF